MCIVLLTTSHPDYALIVLDNRDEFILRPTSRPHWWKSATGRQHILSSRDQQRAEQGTWLGITKTGHLAVLTNYRESGEEAANTFSGVRSRGAIVTAWLDAPQEEETADFVKRILESGEFKGVGGYSLVCGKLRKQKGAKELEPLAILSNRSEHPDQIPWIGNAPGEVYGLSNTHYADPPSWRKIKNGTRMLKEAVAVAVEDDLGEDQLMDLCFKILDTDEFPAKEGLDMDQIMPLLAESIFIPLAGDAKQRDAMKKAAEGGEPTQLSQAAQDLISQRRPDEGPPTSFMTGMYGTQRQTVILVDWDGNVTFKERALWDEHGKEIPRGLGDMTFKYKIDDWEQ